MSFMSNDFLCGFFLGGLSMSFSVKKVTIDCSVRALRLYGARIFFKGKQKKEKNQVP